MHTHTHTHVWCAIHLDIIEWSWIKRGPSCVLHEYHVCYMNTMCPRIPRNETIWDIVCASVGFFSQLIRDIVASWGLTWGSGVTVDILARARTHVVWFASFPQGHCNTHCNTHCNAYCNNCNTLQHIGTRVIQRWLVSSRYPWQSLHVQEYMVCTQSGRRLESWMRRHKTHWYIACLACVLPPFLKVPSTEFQRTSTYSMSVYTQSGRRLESRIRRNETHIVCLASFPQGTLDRVWISVFLSFFHFPADYRDTGVWGRYPIRRYPFFRDVDPEFPRPRLPLCSGFQQRLSSCEDLTTCNFESGSDVIFSLFVGWKTEIVTVTVTQNPRSRGRWHATISGPHRHDPWHGPVTVTKCDSCNWLP